MGEVALTTTVQIRGARIRFEDDGQGEPLLLLHGFPATRYLWSRVAPLLAGAGFRVLVPDLVGYGESEAPSGSRIDITRGLGEGRKVTQPFTVLAFSDQPTVQRRAAEIFASECERIRHPLPPLPRRQRADVIHIGYYSADFHSHATTQLMAGLIDRHDRTRFLVSAFAFGTREPDQVTRRLERSFDRFIPVHTKSDREVAQISRELSIDIAIDLKGFT